MTEQIEPRVIQVKIEDELKTSFLDYSMSFILSRALPDVRDGLKPSQRRILVAMNDLSLVPQPRLSQVSMPLQRLTGLERDKIETEYNELMATIEERSGILASDERQMQIIKDEVDEVTERFGDGRRTEIVYAAEEFDIEDLIAEEDMVVTISREVKEADEEGSGLT